jgi:ABC-type transporter Mla subunit MlaD
MDAIWMLLWPPDGVARAVNSVIALLFAIACWDALWSLLRLLRERALVRDAQSTGVVRNLPEKSLLGERISRIDQLRAAGLGYREVAQQLTLERIDGYGSLARHIGATLTLLGLLGTVVGLSFALFSIQGALGGVSTAGGLTKLTEALAGTLRSMKTAFGCTLAGLLTALLLSFLNHFVRRLQSSVVRELEHFVICALLPQMERLAPDADSAANVFANVIHGVIDGLTQFRDKMGEATAAFQQSVADLGGMVKDLSASAQSFRASAEQVAGNQQAFTAALTETRQAVQGLGASLSPSIEQLRLFTTSCQQGLTATLTETHQAVSALTSVVDHQSRDLSTFTTEGAKVLAEAVAAAGQSAVANREFQTTVSGYHQAFEKLVTEVVAHFQGSLGTILAGAGREQQGRIDATLDALFQRSAAGLEQTLAQNRNEIVKILQESQSQTGKMLSDQNVALRSFSDMIFDVHQNGQPPKPAAGGKHDSAAAHARA